MRVFFFVPLQIDINALHEFIESTKRQVDKSWYWAWLANALDGNAFADTNINLFASIENICPPIEGE